MTIKIGSKGDDVKALQSKLKQAGYYYGYIDGVFGAKTQTAVIKFQREKGLIQDGIVGRKTMDKLNASLSKLPLNPDYFTVWIDAGHGSINQEGRYTTNGKYYNHKDKSIHIGNGYFYEGLENRIVANLAINMLKNININVVRLFHDYKDIPLLDRTEIVKTMEKVGHYGWVHSLHSNATSTDYTKERLDNTQGAIVFTSKGQNISDIAGTILYNKWSKYFGDKLRPNGQKWLWNKNADGDADMEANFYIIHKTESDLIASTLGEFGFFTSHADTLYITQDQVRTNRANAIVRTALDMREQFKKMRV